MNWTVVVVFLAGIAALLRISADWRDVSLRRVRLEERRLDHEENEAEAEAVDHAAGALESVFSDDTEIPEQLKAMIENWDDEWAREDQKRVILDLKRQYGTWDKVIANMPSA